jgi:hypothetical protein
MSAVFDNNIKQNQHLEVHDILKWLEEDAMVDVENAHMLRTLAVGADYKKKNPLEVIAERNWVNLDTQNAGSSHTVVRRPGRSAIRAYRPAEDRGGRSH